MSDPKLTSLTQSEVYDILAHLVGRDLIELHPAPGGLIIKNKGEVDALRRAVSDQFVIPNAAERFLEDLTRRGFQISAHGYPPVERFLPHLGEFLNAKTGELFLPGRDETEIPTSIDLKLPGFPSAKVMVRPVHGVDIMWDKRLKLDLLWRPQGQTIESHLRGRDAVVFRRHPNSPLHQVAERFAVWAKTIYPKKFKPLNSRQLSEFRKKAGLRLLIAGRMPPKLDSRMIYDIEISWGSQVRLSLVFDPQNHHADVKGALKRNEKTVLQFAHTVSGVPGRIATAALTTDQFAGAIRSAVGRFRSHLFRFPAGSTPAPLRSDAGEPSMGGAGSLLGSAVHLNVSGNTISKASIDFEESPPLEPLFQIIGAEQTPLFASVEFQIVGATPEEVAIGALEAGFKQTAPIHSGPSQLKIRGATPTSIFSSSHNLGLTFRVIR